MAWVHRTTRDNNKVGFAPTATPAHIGPGSYAPPTAFKKRGPGFAPFASTADRSGGVTTEITAHTTPGPGAYGAPSSPHKQQHLQAETPFLSFQDRFPRQAVTDTPGPGAYKAPSSFKRRGGGKSHKAEAPAVQWVRVPTAPSIPAHAQSYGYEEGQYGELTMQKPPAVGHTGRGTDTAGPGSYNPRTTLKVKKSGTAIWGKSRTTRTDFSKSHVPGPGEYDYAATAPARKTRPSANFASRVTRDSAAPRRRRRKGKNMTPGPGQYEPPTAFKSKFVPERQQFFGSTSRRFGQRRSQSAGPGPGSYEIAAAAAGHAAAGRGRGGKQATPMQPHVGFTSTSARFGLRKPASVKDTPGAGAYDVPTFTDNIKRKPAARNGVFGSTSKRFFTPESVEAPGPGAYDASVKPSKRTADLKAKPSAAFASRNDRFEEVKPTTETPAPGSYNTTKSWRTPSFARPGKAALGGGSPRFAKRKEDAQPGPGAYTVGDPAPGPTVASRKGTLASGAPRFMGGAPDVTPGPGSYDTEYVYGSLHKRTFNMTIAEQEAGWY